MGRGAGSGGGGAGRARAGGGGAGSVPLHSAIPDDGMQRVVPASALAAVTNFDKPVAAHLASLPDAAKHTAQIESLKQLFTREGQAAVDRLGAQQQIRIGVAPSGKLEVINGQHRILAAQQVGGLSIRAKFVRVVE